MNPAHQLCLATRWCITDGHCKKMFLFDRIANSLVFLFKKIFFTTASYVQMLMKKMCGLYYWYWTLTRHWHKTIFPSVRCYIGDFVLASQNCYCITQSMCNTMIRFQNCSWWKIKNNRNFKFYCFVKSWIILVSY